MSPEIVPSQGPLGARIEGLDRGRAGEPGVAALLNRALAEHLLVVVPGERMTPAEMRDFARAFGKPRASSCATSAVVTFRKCRS